MKFNFTLLLLSFVFLGQAQTLPNNNFETWLDKGMYEEPESWDSPNQFTQVFGAFTLTKSTDAYSGDFSARLETIEVANGLYQIPGLLTLGDFTMDFASLSAHVSGGLFLQENVARLTGMYKYTGVAGDSASVVIYNFRRNEGEDMDTIGSGLTFLYDASEWTPFEVIMVNKNDHLPDTFNVVLLSSGSSDMQIGSALLVDSLVIETNTGIIDLWNPVKPLRVFPNPASQTVQFEAGENGTEREIMIFNASGQLLLKTGFNDSRLKLNISSIKPGLLTYSVVEKGKRVYGGSFLKK